jgi:hypothetical protein
MSMVSQTYRGRHAAPDEVDAVVPPEEPTQAVTDADWVTVRRAPAPLPDSQRFVPYVSPRRRSRKALRAIAAVCVLALVAGGGWYAYTKLVPKNDANPTTPPRSPVAATSVSFRSAQAHFVAKFTARPSTRSTHLTASGHKVQGYVAAVASRDVAVGGFTVTPALPVKQVPDMLRGIAMGIAHGGKLGRVSERDYRRHPAITATAGSGAHALRVLAVAYSTRRVYVLVAPTDAALAQLERGFRPIG